MCGMAFWRTQLFLVTNVLVDTWMLTVKPIYKLSNVSDDLKWTTNTCDTIYTHLRGITNNIYGFGRLCSFICLPAHHPSTHISTRPYSFIPVQMTGGQSLHNAMMCDMVYYHFAEYKIGVTGLKLWVWSRSDVPTHTRIVFMANSLSL